MNKMDHNRNQSSSSLVPTLRFILYVTCIDWKDNKQTHVPSPSRDAAGAHLNRSADAFRRRAHQGLSHLPGEFYSSNLHLTTQADPSSLIFWSAGLPLSPRVEFYLLSSPSFLGILVLQLGWEVRLLQVLLGGRSPNKSWYYSPQHVHTQGLRLNSW